MIPVERIKGPILLISGEDDDLWPSARFAEIAMHRLRHARHPFPVNHLRYAHAGHTIAVPYVPVTRLAAPHPVSGSEIAFGGTPEGCAKANEESWPEVLAFLKSATALCE
jgi:dienelactone hydrolase